MKAFILAEQAKTPDEDALALKYVHLSSKSRLYYMMDGIQLRFQVEYQFRQDWLQQEMVNLHKFVRQGFNYQPQMQRMIELSSKPLFFYAKKLISLVDSYQPSFIMPTSNIPFVSSDYKV